MFLSLLLSTLAISSTPDSVAPRTSDRTWVLSIGNSNYQHLDPLPYAGNDAKAFSQVMRANQVPQDQILTLIDVGREKMWKEIASFLARIPQQGKEKMGHSVIFFFSGHGLSPDFKSELFLMPVDAKGASSGLSVLSLREAIEGCKATQKIILLDACHTGAAAPGGAALARADGKRLLDSFGQVEGSFTIASCQGHETSGSYPDKKLGVFTHWLTVGLQGGADGNGDREVTIDELFEFVSKKMTDGREPLGGKQTPLRRFVGASAVVAVLGGRQPGSVWTGEHSVGNELTADLRRLALFIEGIEGNQFKGRMFIGFVGKRLGEWPVSGTWEKHKVTFRDGSKQIEVVYDKANDTLSGVLRETGRFLLRRDTRTPQLTPGMAGQGQAPRRLDVPARQQDWVALRIDSSERRRSAGELHVFDFRGRFTGHYFREQEWAGVQVGSFVFMSSADGNENTRMVAAINDKGLFQGRITHDRPWVTIQLRDTTARVAPAPAVAPATSPSHHPQPSRRPPVFPRLRQFIDRDQN